MPFDNCKEILATRVSSHCPIAGMEQPQCSERHPYSDGSHYEKRGKGEPVCIDDEIPFEIPESWEWSRIEAVSTDPRYGTSAKSQKTGAFPVLRMGNITKDGGLDYSNLVFTSDEREIETYRLFPGAVIFNRTNSCEWVGKTAYYDGSVPAAYAGYLIAFYPILLSGEYINYAMCTPYERDWCKRVKSDGINQSNINSQKLKSFLLPVPPHEEQDRIVRRINEIMPHVDQYGALEEARERLDAELPDRLRKSVLQLAVQGKLVPQDPNDEPASVLLDRIRAKRAALVKVGMLKAPKGGESVIYRTSDGSYYEKRGRGEPTCIDDEIPFEIPESWEWARLGSIVSVLGGKRIPAGRKLTSSPTSQKYIRVSDMQNGSVSTESLQYVPEDIIPHIAKYTISSDDVYITVAGTIGRVGTIPESVSGANLTENANKLVFQMLDKNWLITVLSSPWVQKQIADCTTQVGQPKLAIKRIEELLIPLPSFAEQQRIVARHEELLGQID